MLGQSLGIYKADTLVVGNSTTTNDLVSKIEVKNISGTSVDVKVKRIDKNYNNLTDSNAICWDICFQPDISLSPTSITLTAGEVSAEGLFSGHVYPDNDGNSYTGPITYVFFNEKNPADSVAFTIKYAVSDTVNGQVGFSQSFPSVSQTEYRKAEVDVYPNPASGQLNVAYNLGNGEYKFEIINLVGKTVFQKNLDFQNGKISLNIDKLNPGVYFYVLSNSSESLITRKLVIE